MNEPICWSCAEVHRKRVNREGLASEYLEKPAWSRFREASFGLGVLNFKNSTHAYWEWHRNQDHVSEVWPMRVRNYMLDTCTPSRNSHVLHCRVSAEYET